MTDKSEALKQLEETNTKLLKRSKDLIMDYKEQLKIVERDNITCKGKLKFLAEEVDCLHSKRNISSLQRIANIDIWDNKCCNSKKQHIIAHWKCMNQFYILICNQSMILASSSAFSKYHIFVNH